MTLTDKAFLNLKIISALKTDDLEKIYIIDNDELSGPRCLVFINDLDVLSSIFRLDIIRNIPHILFVI